MSERDIKIQVKLWEQIFRDFEGGDVMSALKTYMATPGNQYAPKPGDLIGIVKENRKVQEGEPDKFEAWDIVNELLRSKEFSRNPQKAFNGLPSLIKKASGGVNELVRASRSDIYRELPFFKRDFMERYESEEHKSEHLARLGIAAPEEKTDEDIQKGFRDEISMIIKRLKGKRIEEV